jgi:hypothetical protein
MLTSHSEICIPPEGGFIYYLGWKYGHLNQIAGEHVPGLLDRLFSLDNTQDWQFDREKLHEYLIKGVPCDFPEMIRNIYRYYMDENCPKKTKWGDKTTGYLLHLHELGIYFPEAQFLHLIRDPRAVAASFLRVEHLSNNIDRIMMEWMMGEESIKEFSTKLAGSKYMRVFYKDLVEEPENTLKKVCEFLGAQYEMGMLDYWKSNRELKLEPARHLGWKKLTLDSVTTERLFAWKVELSEEQIKRITAITLKVLHRYGFGAKQEKCSIKMHYARRLIYKSGNKIRKYLRVWKHKYIA